MIRGESIIGAIGGAAAGYVLWLIAISFAGDNATVGNWGPLVLLGSAVLGVVAALWGWRMRRRRKYLWAAFAFDLPILPVLLTLAVLADVYA
ncbi:hypothetical protein [Mycobacterium montefiorense]|uniref:Uncharacterized protein n=1 Tax=Mycobacterium montefiorense TaxID=154654 RepID=A0AA37PP54_9MYCO|nr:hypothetical protein [Mycobacterium montefiorense]MCV7428912.1 hypothetical protein [Mycobacterium montefiorense]GBG40544.1 hypothetical protein MmonteBS_49160 [Mycobacterium montefiorense]GKU36357.1 hypothetical protein NJB14191_37030 [Mycobacterium montefiorense]GKU39287.1 hypothetical protein NJB14192_12820 [Mycobacterium montefiorense]GKU44724.1 hypothetical protein NJB14194_13500 [Mycobacterium montefiorense]